MLLRTGLIMMAVSVLLAVGAAVVVSLLNQAPAMEQSSELEPLAAESKAQENEKKDDNGQKLEIDDEHEQSAGEARNEDSKSRSELAPRAAERAASRGGESASRRSNLESLPVSNAANWTTPTREELSRLDEPRYFDPDPAATMTLTVEALGLYDVPVIDALSEEALGRGLIHVPDTAYPWDGSDQKNVFLAGHRTGVPGTNGRLLFFDLDELSSGDKIVLEDGAGRSYEYSVTELFRVEPQDGWVADTLVGRDLLTLQTCTYPTFEDRLIVRADRR
jgi:sortase A